MKLSELVDRCTGADPELVIEDDNGIPRPVTEADLGVRMTNGGPVAYVLLESARDEES